MVSPVTENEPSSVTMEKVPLSKDCVPSVEESSLEVVDSSSLSWVFSVEEATGASETEPSPSSDEDEEGSEDASWVALEVSWLFEEEDSSLVSDGVEVCSEELDEDRTVLVSLLTLEVRLEENEQEASKSPAERTSKGRDKRFFIGVAPFLCPNDKTRN